MQIAELHVVPSEAALTTQRVPVEDRHVPAVDRDAPALTQLTEHAVDVHRREPDRVADV